MMNTILRHLAVGLLLIALVEAVALAHAVISTTTPAPAGNVVTPSPHPHPGFTLGHAAGAAAVELARR